MRIKRMVVMSSIVTLLLSVLGCKGQALTKNMLQEATSVEFYTDNGTLPPDYQWGMTVTVTRDKVRLRITRGYGERVGYDKTMALTADNYSKLTAGLAAMNIRKKRADNNPTSGGSTRMITVKRGSEVLFQGSEDYNMTCERGDLFSVFHDILGTEMSQIMRHPDHM